MAGIKALFLDRDGVVNEDRGYVHKREDFEWMPGFFELCRAAAQRGYALVIVTNQSGIGRGYYTEEQFHLLMGYVREELERQGAPLLDFYFCPHLEHENRKPLPGMFLQARDDHHIDMAASVGVGDSERDMTAGRAAGVGRNYLLSSAPEPSSHADGIIPDLKSLIPLL